MRTFRFRGIATVVAGAVAVLLVVVSPWLSGVRSADHREARQINEDPAADINDLLAFVSPADPDKVVFIVTVNPFLVPAVQGGYSFSPDVLYQVKIDNAGGASESVVMQASFAGTEVVRDPRCPVMTSGPAAGQGGQFVTVLVGAPRGGGVFSRDQIISPREVSGCTNLVLGPTADGIRAFAGRRDDPFVADVGQLNRILSGAQALFRAFVSPALGALSGRPTRPDGTSGVDTFGGFNVSAIAVEVPRSLVQGTAPRVGTYLQNATTIGVWATTSRREVTRLSSDGPNADGAWIQIQRVGQQVVKTVFVPQGQRDAYNGSFPQFDVQNWSQLFPDTLTIEDNDGTGNTIAGRAALLDAVGVTAVPNGAPLLLPASLANTDRNLIRKVFLPDVLRLDLSLAAGDLGIAGNGLQNGRRPGDDVIDILLLVARQLADVKFPDGSGLPGSGPVGTRSALVFGTDFRVNAVLQGTDFMKPDAQLGDLSTSGNDRALLAAFPFLAGPHPLPGTVTPPTVGFPPQQ